MQSVRWRHILLAAALLLPVAVQSQVVADARTPADVDASLEWFHGAWNIVYEDAALGPVRGRAVVSSGKQGLEVRIRFLDPRNGKYQSLQLAAAAGVLVDANHLEFKLQGNSPPSGYSDPAELRATHVLQIPSGSQIQARLQGAPPAYVIVRQADQDPPLADPYLSLKIPVPAGARESLAPEWSYWIHRPRDMALNRAGAVIEHDGGRLARGVESWTRPAPIVTDVTDADLPSPARLAAGKSAPTPERAALEARWGPDIYAVAWLRVDGVDLPLQPKRSLRVDFEDAGIVWTGESRADEANPESLDIRVQILKGVGAGPKWFNLNGSAGRWDYGVEPVAIRHLRSLTVDGIDSAGEPDVPRFESANELYLGEIVRVEVEYASEPAFSTHVFASRVGNDAPVRYEIRKVAGEKTLFRSGPILLDGDAPVDAAAEEGLATPQPVEATIIASAGAALRSEEPEAMAPSRGRTVGLTRILERPASLWNKAMQSAASCRRSGKAPEEISRRIVTAGFNKRSLAVSLEDHAAALLLRDELALELTRYADAEHRALARGGAMQAAYTAQLITEARQLRRTEMTDLEVRTPDNQELVLLRTALTGEMESRWFKGDSKAFFNYATQAVAAARRELADSAWSTAEVVRSIDDCDVERILGTVRAGLGPVVANVQQKLLRPPRGGEPSVPRWVPDRVARAHVGSLSLLAEGFKALTEYSSIDTDVVIAAATVVTLGGGGLAGVGGKLATSVGREAAGQVLGQVATGAAWTGIALDVADLGLTVNDFAQYSEALAEVRLAEGLVGIGGDERLRQAREDAENKAFGLALKSTLLAGGALVTGVQVARAPKTATPANAAAQADSAAAPATPIADVEGTAPVTPSATKAPQSAAKSVTKPNSGGVLDRPEFRNLPDKPPAEAPDLDRFMTPEELAAKAASGHPSPNPATVEGFDSATAATVIEPGRPPPGQPGSASTGPTGTAIDQARAQPKTTAAASTNSGEEFSVDLSQPGNIQKLDERIAVERNAADTPGAADGADGLLSRPEFRDLPRKPPAESPDLDAYRSAEELAERKRLSTMDTAAMPAAQPQAAAPTVTTPDTATPPPVTESRIARSNEGTVGNPATTETKTRLPGPDSPGEIENRLAAPNEETPVLRPQREPVETPLQPEEFDPNQPIEGFEEAPAARNPETAPARDNTDMAAAAPKQELEQELARRTMRQQARDRLDEARVAQQRTEIEEAQRLGRFDDEPGVTGITAPPMRGANDGLRPHRQLLPDDAEYLDNIMNGRATSPAPGELPQPTGPVFRVAPERMPPAPDGSAPRNLVGPVTRGQNDVAAHLINDYVRRILTEPTFPRSANGDPIEILLGNPDFVGSAGHHRLIAAVIASRLTGRPLYGAPNAIIPEDAIVFRFASESRRADTARAGWRMGVTAPLDDPPGSLRARFDSTQAAAQDLQRRAAVAAQNGDTSGADQLRRQAAHLDWRAGVEGRGLRDEEPISATPVSPTPRPAPSAPPGGSPRRIDRSVAGERYYVLDSSNPRFVASGEVYDLRSELSIQIRTELEDGTRSQVLRGAEEFDRITEFFRGKFTSIRANWLYGSNLAKVNELTGPPHNLSLAEAVTKTWTADQARKAGFPIATDVSGAGSPGHYTAVQVSFTK